LWHIRTKGEQDLNGAYDILARLYKFYFA